MLQADLFWVFAMGAYFAAMAGDNLKKTDSMFVNKYFVFTLAFFSVIFAPGGAYLLWQFPEWGSMFVSDRSLHGIWACLFVHANVSVGLLGFCVGYKVVTSTNDLAVHKYWTGAYSGLFATMSFCYDRSLYTGRTGSYH